MFEYFNFLSRGKSINIGGMDINQLLLVGIGIGVAVVVVYALMRVSK